jgi:hypothetical protein
MKIARRILRWLACFYIKTTNQTSQHMKKSICLAASLLALNLTPVFGQPNGMPPSGPNYAQRLNTIVQRANGSPQNEPPALTKFNLDFPGGTPAQLVKAIEKATGKPLNVIISDKDAAAQLPPLKLNNVNVSELFNALQSASMKVESYVISSSYVGFPSSYQQATTYYGFKTDGTVTDDSIWYFHVEQPSLPPVVSIQKVCRFYQLAPYLERGLTVDDITTAIQTGWKMMSDTSTPEISFHKETKLLMAVGEPDKLEVIDNVLRALQPLPQNLNPTFQDRLKEIMKNSAPVAPPRFAPPPTQGSAAPALSPEAQVIAIEAERQRMQQSANPLPPAPLLPPAPNLPAEKSGK